MRFVRALLVVPVRAIAIAGAVFRLKLFCDAQASIKVPSTEKWSSDKSGFTCGWFRSFVMNF
jgi:hypothetical protein